MIDKHYLEAPNKDAEVGIEPDHSDLTSLYPSATKEKLGPWLQEEERQKQKAEARQNLHTGVRKFGPVIGLYTSLPFVLGLLLLQFFATSVRLENATYFLTIIILLSGLYVGIIIALLKSVGRTFHKFGLKALPITLTILGSLFFVSQPLVRHLDQLIGGIPGYITYLVSLSLLGTVLGAALVTVWTSKISPLLKIVTLAVFLGVAAAISFLW